jgi:hypothetical protein
MENNAVYHEKHCVKMQMCAVPIKELIFIPNRNKKLSNQEGKGI